MRLKDVAEVIAGQSPPSEDVHELGVGMPFLQGNAEFGKRNPSPHLECSTAVKHAAPGDVLVSVRAPVGAVNIADRSYAIGRGLCAIHPRAIDATFLAFWLESQSELLNSVANGSTFVAVTAPEVAELELRIENPIQQRLIGDFLDRETAEIDAFIADQEELIALLAERRLARLQDAVSPRAMDSGWRRHGVRRVARAFGGAGFPIDFQGESEQELPFYKVDSLNSVDRLGTITASANTVSRATAAQLRAHIFPAGSIVIAKIGAALSLGRVSRIAKPACIDNNMLGLEPFRSTSSEFVRYNLLTVDLRSAVNPGALPSLDLDAYLDYPLAWPPLDEQHAIVARLDAETAEIGAAIADAREAIALSKERRSALISAAVTGQIDVTDRYAADAAEELAQAERASA